MSSVAEEENLKQEGAIHPSPKGLGFLASTDKERPENGALKEEMQQLLQSKVRQ